MKRRWFQVHLSTAFFLMIVAACLVWANSIPVSDKNKGRTILSYGWPDQMHHRSFLKEGPEFALWLPTQVASNCLVALIVLISTALACEWVTNWSSSTVRQWYQPHLLIRILFLTMLAGLVALNLQETRSRPVWPFDRFYGWPWTFIESDSDTPGSTMTLLFHSRKVALIGNCAVGFSILLAVCGVFEWLIRRREARGS